ncbi:MAG: DNA primase [Pseudobdellovibrio sp.]
MGYPQDFIDKVIDSTSLVDIISQYTQLKPSGRGHMGRCPFPDHQEKTASFSVSDAKQVYHCFGCKKSGNVITFLKDYNGMSFPEALEYLADRSNIPIPEMNRDHNDQASQAHDHKKKLLKANKLAADFFREILKRSPADHPIKSYIQKRKLNAETLEEFQIGYSPNEWELLVQNLNRQGISMEIADEAKLVKRRQDGTGYFDLFRDRLMFPIQSPSGEVLAFGGRIHDQGEPKYLNSPESPVFHKGKVLYGLAQTARHIRSEDLVLVVEGYMDLVSLFQAGLKNAVATMGTALTPDHARLIKRLTQNVVVLFDGDEAGQMAAERSLPILLSQGLYPRGLTLVDAKDPDEYVIKFGVESLRQKIQSSPDLFNVVIKSWMIGYRGEASEKVRLVDKIRPIFDAITDNRLKSLYADDLCQMMSVTKVWLRDSLSGKTNAQGRQSLEVNHQQAKAQNPVTEVGSEDKLKLSDASKVELMLLQNVLKSRANFDYLLQLNRGIHSTADADSNDDSFKQLLSQIKHLGVRQILENALEVYRQDVHRFDKLVSLLIDKIDKPELLFQSSKLDAVSVSEFDEEKEKKLVSDLVNRVQQEFVKAEAKRLVLDVKKDLQINRSANLDDEKLRQISDLQKSRLSLKNKN